MDNMMNARPGGGTGNGHPNYPKGKIVQGTARNGRAFPPATNKLDDYDILAKVGEGTYGHVYKALCKKNNKTVALKRLLNVSEEEDGLPFTSVREIKFLTQLRSVTHVVTLLDSFFGKDGELVCVFEWMDHDLSGLLSTLPGGLPLANAKCYMKQLLEALFEVHQRGLMHRDIKAANMLLNNEGGLFLADLGLMTSFTCRKVFSNNVVTRWYKPPELLLGATNYGPEVDMWGVGCVLVEMLTGKTLFPGRNEKHQLGLILNICGTEDLVRARAANLKLSKLKAYPQVLQEIQKAEGMKVRKTRLREKYSTFPDEVIDLLNRLLAFNPEERMAAKDALDHDFFWKGVQPTDCKDMPVFPSIHEYEVKVMRKNEKLKPKPVPRQPNKPFGRPPHHHPHHHKNVGAFR